MEKLRTSNQKISYVPAAITPRQQAQFIQATLVLVGIILGNSFSQWFYMLDIFMGISLLVASLTGSCLLENGLAKFPWNKPLLVKKD
jgi:hypothetical protein